jgi:hypothetical protein
MLERILLPLAMLVTVLAIGLVMVISHASATGTVAMATGVTEVVPDGPPTCCAG